MGEYWKYYLRIAVGTVLCIAGWWLLYSIGFLPDEGMIIYLLYLLILALPVSSLYLLRRGVPLSIRVLLLFLSPASILLAFILLVRVYFIFFPFEFGRW